MHYILRTVVSKQGFIFIVVYACVTALWLIIFQRFSIINHDVAANYVYSENILSGLTPYSDFFDQNLPVIWFVGLLPALIAQSGLLSDIHAIMLCGIVVTLVSVWSGMRSYIQCYGNVKSLVIGALFFYMMLLFSGYEVFQREYMTVCFLLPMISMPGNRQTGYWRNAIAGCIAGIGISIKPHFMLVLVMLYLWSIWQDKKLYSVTMRPLLFSFGTTVGIWMLILVLYPQYFDMLTLARATYTKGVGVLSLANSAKVVILFNMAYIVCRHVVRGQYTNRTSHNFYIASCAFLIIALVQGKGFGYHFYPALFFSAGALVGLVFELNPTVVLGRNRIKRLHVIILVSGFMITFGGLYFVRAIHKTYNNYVLMTRDVIESLQEIQKSKNQNHHPVTVYNLSTNVPPVSQICLEAGYTSVASFECLWFLGGFHNTEQLHNGKVQCRPPKDSLEAVWYNHIIRDVIEKKPDYILTDVNESQMFFIHKGFSTLGYYSQNDVFRTLITTKYDTVYHRNYTLILGLREQYRYKH
ncbi:MAG: hypothetical protein JNL32_02920 [Candidatus Kapabacteria bacterium]|nr:hypothetical protein [Candidatus Kapabacteria bacterium]